MKSFRETIKLIEPERSKETIFKQHFVGAIILTQDNRFVLQQIVDARTFFPAGSVTTFSAGKLRQVNHQKRL